MTEETGQAGGQDQPQPPPGPPVVARVAPPAARVDRWAHRRGEPRTFTAAWVLYLLAALVLSLGSAGARGLIWTDVYRASSQVLMVLIGIGLGVLWPMLRLSQESPQSLIRSAWADTLIVAAPVHAIIWPQFLPWMAAWPLEVVAALAAHMTAWTIFVAGWVALGLAGVQRWGWERWQVMLALLAIQAVGPIVATFGLTRIQPARVPAEPNLWLTASPITGGWEITRDRAWMGLPAAVSEGQWVLIAVLAVVAITLWIAAAAVNPPEWHRRRGAP